MPHLSKHERDVIAQLRARGYLQVEIARHLNRHPSTISRELARGMLCREYYPGRAQAQSEQRRRDRPLKRKMTDPFLLDAVRGDLVHECSPDQIAGRLRREHPAERSCQVSAPTIYAWIKRHAERRHWESFLRRRGKRRARRQTPPNPAKARIKNRPDVIERRARLGDFEGDTVLGKQGTGGLVTLVDRHSRYTIITKITSKDADHVRARITLRLRELSAEQRRSITLDNGTEFAACDRLEKQFEIKLYYADPGCPHQRGTNENTNGLLRQYFPKGTDFRTVSHHEVRQVENVLNDRPRRCLDYQTPAEVFYASNREPCCV
jgi:transposase, IS30 family